MKERTDRNVCKELIGYTLRNFVQVCWFGSGWKPRDFRLGRGMKVGDRPMGYKV